MFKFALKLIIFFLPISVIFLFPAFIYWQAGEFMPVPEIAAAQQGNKEVLFGMLFENVVREYKRQLVIKRDPTIITIGASRVFQFKDFFFASSTHFTNAGGAVALLGIQGQGGIRDYTDFLKSLPPDNHISVIIMGVDPFMFQPGQTFGLEGEPDSVLQRVGQFLVGDWRRVYYSYYDGKFTLTRLFEKKKEGTTIGVLAMMDDTGFLNDGSFFEGTKVEPENHREILANILADRNAALIADRGGSEYSDTISADSMQNLRDFLAYCKEKNIYVIGYMPPHPHLFIETLMSKQDGISATVTRLPKKVKTVFDTENYPFFDYTDGATVGIPDTEYLDDLHTSDKGQLRILIDMTEKVNILKKYVSLPALKMLLAKTKDDYIETRLPAYADRSP
jgi:hypothetical protein